MIANNTLVSMHISLKGQNDTQMWDKGPTFRKKYTKMTIYPHFERLMMAIISLV